MWLLLFLPCDAGVGLGCDCGIPWSTLLQRADCGIPWSSLLKRADCGILWSTSLTKSRLWHSMVYSLKKSRLWNSMVYSLTKSRLWLSMVYSLTKSFANICSHTNWNNPWNWKCWHDIVSVFLVTFWQVCSIALAWQCGNYQHFCAGPTNSNLVQKLIYVLSCSHKFINADLCIISIHWKFGFISWMNCYST